MVSFEHQVSMEWLTCELAIAVYRCTFGVHAWAPLCKEQHVGMEGD